MKRKVSMKKVKLRNLNTSKIFSFFFFYRGFLSRTFTIHGTAGEGGGYLFNSSLPLSPASQALRHWPSDYCRELTSAHSWQPDSNREPLVSERKLLTTKLRFLKYCPNYFLSIYISVFIFVSIYIGIYIYIHIYNTYITY